MVYLIYSVCVWNERDEKRQTLWRYTDIFFCFRFRRKNVYLCNFEFTFRHCFQYGFQTTKKHFASFHICARRNKMHVSAEELKSFNNAKSTKIPITSDRGEKVIFFPKINVFLYFYSSVFEQTLLIDMKWRKIKITFDQFKNEKKRFPLKIIERIHFVVLLIKSLIRICTSANCESNTTNSHAISVILLVNICRKWGFFREFWQFKQT